MLLRLFTIVLIVSTTSTSIAQSKNYITIGAGYDLLSFKGVDLQKLTNIWPDLSSLDKGVRDQLEKDAVYVNYIDRQSSAVEAMRKDEQLSIPENFNFKDISGLSNEIKQKLAQSRPSTLAQAGRIEGMTPAALALILTSIRRSDVKKSV